MTYNNFEFEPYGPQQPAPPQMPMTRISQISLPSLSEAERSIGEQKQREARIHRAAIATLQNIENKDSSVPISQRYTIPPAAAAGEPVTISKAIQDYKDIQNFHAIPVKEGDAPKELIQTAGPGFFARAIAGYGDNIAKPLQAPVYYGLIKMEQAKRKVESAIGTQEYTAEEETEWNERREIAENALETYMGEHFLRRGILYGDVSSSASEFGGMLALSEDEQKKKAEEASALLETAWNSNPLPKFHLGLLEAVLDPLNLIQLGFIVKILKTGWKYGLTGAKLSSSFLGKYGRKLIGQSGEVLDDVAMPAERAIIDSNTLPVIQDFTKKLTELENLSANISGAIPPNVPMEMVHDSIALGSKAEDMAHPMRSQGAMSKLLNWTKETAAPPMRFLIPVAHNIYHIMHKSNMSRRIQRAFETDIQTGDYTNGILVGEFEGLARHGEGSFNFVSEGIVRIGRKENTTVWQDTIGIWEPKSKKYIGGIINKQISDLNADINAITKSIKNKERTTPLKQLKKIKAELEEKKRYLKSEHGALVKMFDQADKTTAQFSDVMEWQNLFDISVPQKATLDAYNNQYLPWLQDNFRRMSDPQAEFINKLTGRRYFPRAIDFSGKAAPNYGKGSMKKVMHERTMKGSFEEGTAYGINYKQNPFETMKAVANGVVRARSETQLAELFEPVINNAINRALALVVKNPNTVVLKGAFAKVLKSIKTFDDIADAKKYKYGMAKILDIKASESQITAREMADLIARGDIEPMSEIAFEFERIAKQYGGQQDEAIDIMEKVIAFASGPNIGVDDVPVHQLIHSTAESLSLVKSRVEYLATQYPGQGFKIISKYLDSITDDTGKITKNANEIIKDQFTLEDLEDFKKAYAKFLHQKREDFPKSSGSLVRQIFLEGKLHAQGKKALGDGLTFGRNLSKVINETLLLKPNQMMHLTGFKVSARTGEIVETWSNVAKNTAMSPVNIVRDITQVLRYWGTGYDAGWAVINGLYLLTSGREGAKTWGRMWVHFADAISNPNWRGFTSKLYSEEREISRIAVDSGVVLEQVAEQTDAIVAANKLVSGAARSTDWIAAIPSRFTIKGRGLSLQNMPIMFQQSGNYARLMMFKAKLPQAHIHALKTMKLTEAMFKNPAVQNNVELMAKYNELASANRRIIADNVNKTTGVLNMSQRALSTERRAIESSLFFAPRFVRSQVELMADLLRGDLKGELARESVAKLIASGTIFYTAICLATGQEPKLNPLPRNQGGDGGQFMTWKVPGTDRLLGIGGSMITILKFLGRTIAAGADGDALDEDFDKDPLEMSFTRFLTNKMSPSLSLGRTIMTGETYGGRQLEWKGDGWGDSFGKSLTTMATLANENLTPFWTVALADGPDGSYGSRATGAAAEFLGFQSYPESPWAIVEEIKSTEARKLGVPAWDQLDRDQQTTIKRNNPDLLALEEIADTAGWGSAPKNKVQKELESMFDEIEIASSEKRNLQSQRLESFLNAYPGAQARKTIQEINREFARKYDNIKEKYPEANEYLDRAVSPEDMIPNLESARMAYMRLVWANPDLYDESKPAGETLDYDLRDILEEAFVAKYGAESINYIERSWVSTHSEEDPLSVEYHMVMRELRQWFSIEKNVVNNAATYGDGSNAVGWERYKAWKNNEIDDSDINPREKANMIRMRSVVSKAKELYRKSHADKEHMLIRWGFITSDAINVENKGNDKFLRKTNSIYDYAEILDRLSVKYTQ